MSSNWGMDIEVAGILKQCGGQPTGTVQQMVYDATPVYGPKVAPPVQPPVHTAGHAGVVGGVVGGGCGSAGAGAGAGRHYVSRPAKPPSFWEKHVFSLSDRFRGLGDRLQAGVTRTSWYKPLIVLLAVAGAIWAGGMAASTPGQNDGVILFMALAGTLGGALAAPAALFALRTALMLVGGLLTVTAVFAAIGGGIAVVAGAIWLLSLTA